MNFSGFKALIVRDLKLFIKTVFPAILAAGIMLAAGVAVAFFAFKSSEKSFSPIKIALVNEDSTVPEEFSVSMVSSNIRAISELLEIQTSDIVTARQKLENDEIIGIIRIPDGFVESYMSGQNTSVEIISASTSPLEAELLEKLAKTCQYMLITGQKGVYAVQNTMIEQNQTEKLGDISLKINLLLIERVLNTPRYFAKNQKLPLSRFSLPVIYNYFLAFGIFDVICGNVFFGGFSLADTEKSLYGRIRALKISGFMFWMCKFLFVLLYNTMLIFVVSKIASYFSEKEVDSKALFCLFLASVFVSSLVMFVFFLLKNPRDGTLFIVIIAAAGIFLGGGIVPQYRLPTIATQFYEFTPSGVISRLVLPALGGEISISVCISAAVFSVISALFCIFGRRFD